MNAHFILDFQKDELAQVNFKKFYSEIAPLLTKVPNIYLKVDKYPHLEFLHSKYPFSTQRLACFALNVMVVRLMNSLFILMQGDERHYIYPS